ncbi:MAG: transglutaminase-like domain-containing protein [Deltaproteobacteria bacterium]|nr:transglutaminase-like domain-containing protein [Deltaproteobacteria bacterium]MCX7952332.1 transglutaminase-like domain-containing protein [Deltaproteobacteria bacterium]
MVFIRTVALFLIGSLLSNIYKVEINYPILALCLVAGAYAGYLMSLSRLRKVPMLLGSSVIGVLGYAILSSLSFSLDSLKLEASFFRWDILFYGFSGIYAFFSTAFASKSAGFLLIEGLIFAVFILLGLEETRDLNLSMSRFIYTGARVLGVSDIQFITIFGGLVAGTYLFGIFYRIYSTSITRGVVSWTIFVLIFALIASITIARHYEETSLKKPMGVSFDNAPSPLSFDSFVGTSQQATALVKLNTTYFDPRTSPLLYFRETALSKFNGRELVKSEFNKDVPTLPVSALQEISTSLGFARVFLNQTMYLLINHSLPFSVDLGLKYRPLPNPNPEKFFGGAFTVLSFSPIFYDQYFYERQLGSPDWDKNTWDHYTEKHHDPRYEELARVIVGNELNKFRVIRRLVDYINKNYIYTVKPNHNVPPNEDPVAPFLFGDKRGYCVHIAHALVYMFRSLNIPSRIGVGYATDINQSRDGYILLRMSDRHAWPEVYFDQLGWVVFDAQPEQVESHVDAPVDEELLKSLIKEVEKNDGIDSNNEKQDEKAKIKARNFWSIVGALVLLSYVLIKAYLWFGYLVFRTKKHLALSILSVIYDCLGGRKTTETLEDFLSKIDANKNITLSILETFFGTSVGIEKLNISPFRRVVGFFNPVSFFRYFVIKRW